MVLIKTTVASHLLNVNGNTIKLFRNPLKLLLPSNIGNDIMDQRKLMYGNNVKDYQRDKWAIGSQVLNLIIGMDAVQRLNGSGLV